MNEIQENLVTYKNSARVNVETANILLLGEPGAGKSSFFNSLNSDIREKITCKIVLLIKLVCSNVNHNMTNTFTSSSICHAVNKVADITGRPRSHVLPVKNYESETELKTEINILLLEALRRCLNFADDFIDEQIDNLHPEKKENLHKHLLELGLTKEPIHKKQCNCRAMQLLFKIKIGTLHFKDFILSFSTENKINEDHHRSTVSSQINITY